MHNTLRGLQGYLAYIKSLPPRTLLKACAYDPVVVLGGGVVSYERGTPVRDPETACSSVFGGGAYIPGHYNIYTSTHFSTVTQVNRSSTFVLGRSTLDFCLGGQRFSKGTAKNGPMRRLPAPLRPPLQTVVSYQRGTPVGLDFAGVIVDRGTSPIKKRPPP